MTTYRIPRRPQPMPGTVHIGDALDVRSRPADPLPATSRIVATALQRPPSASISAVAAGVIRDRTSAAASLHTPPAALVVANDPPLFLVLRDHPRRSGIDRQARLAQQDGQSACKVTLQLGVGCLGSHLHRFRSPMPTSMMTPMAPASRIHRTCIVTAHLQHHRSPHPHFGRGSSSMTRLGLKWGFSRPPRPRGSGYPRGLQMTLVSPTA